MNGFVLGIGDLRVGVGLYENNSQYNSSDRDLKVSKCRPTYILFGQLAASIVAEI